MQISFQRQYNQRVVPVYRESSGDPWIPTEQHSIAAPPDAGTPGYAKWQALKDAGAEVVGHVATLDALLDQASRETGVKLTYLPC